MWWVALAWAADCPDVVTRQAFIDTLTEADVAVLSLDPQGLMATGAVVEARLPCVREALDPGDVAWTFRVLGMADAVAGSTDEALASFVSARALAPDYKISRTLSEPTQALWASADVPASEAITLPRPRSGWLLVDGTRSTAGPGGRAFVLQWVDVSGVQLTARVDDASVLPDYPLQLAPVPLVSVVEIPLPAAEPEPPEPPPVPTRHPSRPLAVGALATGVGALGLTAASLGLRNEFLASDRPSDELGRTIAANRAATAGALTLGGAFVGLGASAVLVGRW